MDNPRFTHLMSAQGKAAVEDYMGEETVEMMDFDAWKEVMEDHPPTIKSAYSRRHLWGTGWSRGDGNRAARE